MPDQPVAPAEQFADLSFPLGGIDLLRAFSDQRPRQLRNVALAYELALEQNPNLAQNPNAGMQESSQLNTGEWTRTCRSGINVRGYEALTQRWRGGSRAGLKKYIPVAPVSGWVLQELAVITSTSSSNKA